MSKGRTFVPVRYLSNALGITDEHITWESPKVILDEPGFPIVTLAVGSPGMNVNDGTRINGKLTIMDVEPLIKEGRTYLPARWVAEALGYQVDWDAENSIVLCYPKGAERPDVSNVIEYIKGQPVIPVSPVTPPVQPEPPIQPVSQVQQPSGEAINLYGKGESISKYPWAKQYTPEFKINWLTYEEFNSNVYQVDDGYGALTTYGMRVTKDRVYLTTAGHTSTISLYDGGDVLRARQNFPGFDFKPELREKHEYSFSVVNDVDKYANWPSADITKISHIFISWANTILAVENPLYQGGNN